VEEYMKNSLLLAVGLCVKIFFSYGPVYAQNLHYDPYYSLPSSIGTVAATVGVSNPNLNKSKNLSTIFATGKYALNDMLEAGIRIDLGFLHDARDDFSSLLVGAKYRVNELSAVTFNLLAPYGDVADPGVSVGYMINLQAGKAMVENHLQVGFLDGFTGGVGSVVQVLIRPSLELGTTAVGHLDITGTTNTDNIADFLGIDIAPNVDVLFGDNARLNLGLSIGIAGDLKQDDLGIKAALLCTSPSWKP
jgi:hypothetical protein